MAIHQPQYVLLRSAVTPHNDSPYEYEFYKKDTLLVVKVNQMFIHKSVRRDDYNKNRLVKDLDKEVLMAFADSASLIPPGNVTSLSINTVEGENSLRFYGSRLDGRFSRTKNGKTVIKGFYKMGLEDSTWTFRDTSSTHVMILTISIFIRELNKLDGFSIEKAIFCMEHTGVYNNYLLSCLDKKKANICLESAMIIKNSLGKLRGKNDKIDSLRISEYCYEKREKLRF